MDRFRLAVLSLATFGSIALTAPSIASADSQTCSTSAVPPSVSSAGTTELVSDVVLSCTGGTPTVPPAQIPTANITLFFNSAVTSRLIAPASEARLDYGGGNFYDGIVSGNSITWFGIPIDPPGAGVTRTLRFTNIRLNASGIGVGPNGTPGQLIASISVSGSTSVLISNPTPTIGFVLPGLVASARNAASSKVLTAPATLMQCATAKGARVATLRYAEQFPTDFKRRNVATTPQAPLATADQNVPGMIYNTETGLYDHTRSALAGLADFGTRIKVVFKKVPAGMSLYVDTGAKNVNGADVARLTSSEAGAFSARAADPNGPPGAAKVALANGTGTAVWEILQSDPLTLATLDIGVYASYKPKAPKLGTATANQSYAPIVLPLSASTQASTGPIPRFTDTSTATKLFQVKACPPGTTQPANPTSGPAPAPDSNIARIRSPIRSGSLSRFRGTASDPHGRLKEVDVALVRLDGGARAARRACRTLGSNGKLRSRRLVRGRCRTLAFLRARGTTHWSFKLKRKLPPGSYVLYSRAVDRGGARESSFSARDRNRRAFRVN